MADSREEQGHPMEIDREAFGERMREALEASGLNQSDIAKYFDIKRAAVSQWVTGITLPQPERWEPLARLLKVRAQWLIYGMGLRDREPEMPLRDQELLRKINRLGENERRMVEQLIDLNQPENEAPGARPTTRARRS